MGYFKQRAYWLSDGYVLTHLGQVTNVQIIPNVGDGLDLVVTYTMPPSVGNSTTSYVETIHIPGNSYPAIMKDLLEAMSQNTPYSESPASIKRKEFRGLDDESDAGGAAGIAMPVQQADYSAVVESIEDKKDLFNKEKLFFSSPHICYNSAPTIKAKSKLLSDNCIVLLITPILLISIFIWTKLLKKK